MSSTDPVSKPDEPSPEAVGSVRDHLKEVIASRAFAGSKRAQDFLQLIVEHALAGRFDSLRERMIGAEMFGRPIDGAPRLAAPPAFSTRANSLITMRRTLGVGR